MLSRLSQSVDSRSAYSPHGAERRQPRAIAIAAVRQPNHAARLGYLLLMLSIWLCAVSLWLSGLLLH